MKYLGKLTYWCYLLSTGLGQTYFFLFCLSSTFLSLVTKNTGNSPGNSRLLAPENRDPSQHFSYGLCLLKHPKQRDSIFITQLTYFIQLSIQLKIIIPHPGFISLNRRRHNKVLYSPAFLSCSLVYKGAFFSGKGKTSLSAQLSRLNGNWTEPLYSSWRLNLLSSHRQHRPASSP